MRASPRYSNACAAMLTAALAGAAPPAQAQSAAPAAAQEPSFNITSFVVSGAILPQNEIDALLAPFTGSQRVFGHIQRAIDALEGVLRSRGLSAVRVFAPEQTLGSGVVRLVVATASVASINIEGQAFFDTTNIHAALPSLKIGATPNALDIAANVRLANENPARQIDVVLGAGAKEDEIHARVAVSDSNPKKFTASIDNAGRDLFGLHRLSFGVQHSNLFNADHGLTARYITSLEKPELVSIYSFGYRVPLYRHDASVDLFYVKSTVGIGSSATVAGPLTFTGKGHLLGLRFNQHLARQGEYTHQLTYGFDYKAFEQTCSLGTFGAVGCGPAAFPVTSHPFSLAYSGGWTGHARQTNFSVSVAANWAWGHNGFNGHFQAVRPAAAGVAQGGARASFSIFKGNLSHTEVLPGDLQIRGNLSAQWAPQALILQEQFGLTGATAVRGFQEAEFFSDRGIYGNLELYGPDWGAKVMSGSGLRLLLFYDVARGYPFRLPGDADQRLAIASAGFGARFNIGTNLTLRADYARVTDARVMNLTSTQVKGDARGHISLALTF